MGRSDSDGPGVELMTSNRWTPLLVVLVAGLLVAAPAQAQYFGQNKVQYRNFDFKVLKTKHFDIYYYPEEQAKTEQVARLAERWYERFSRLFEANLDGRQPILFYASPADFRQTNAVGGELGEGTGGVTEGLRRRIVMPSAGALAETSHVLGHELVHAFQYSISSRNRSTGFLRLPLWMVEGLAEYLSLGPVDSQTAMWLRDSLASDKLPTLKDLGNPRFFPYRYGHAFWAYVGGRWGDKAVIELFSEAMRSGDPNGAIQRVLQIAPKEFSKDWGAAIRQTYGSFIEKQKSADAYGPVVIDKEHGGGELNVGPALSPDGKRIAYLSERDLFSVDLYLADAESGKVIRKLASTATDPHFDSLEWIESAGSFAPDGRRFVQSAVRKGKGALAIIDTDTGERVKEVDFDDLGEVQTPSFLLDGHRIIFSALQGGTVDMWVYDLDSGTKTRLTNDPFAEMQPVVSPDGSEAAFVTDRFSTDLATLRFGNYRLGLIDLKTAEITELPSYEGARHTNPQWSPDGKSLYFVSDVDGAANVHRLDLATGELRQLTHLRTGVAGITPLSPSLSVARDSGRIVYSAREDGKYPIYAIGQKTVEEAPPTARIALNESAIILPPRSEPGGEVEKLLADVSTGLPQLSSVEPEPYKSGFGLEYVGQPSVGVGVSRFGTYVGGSTSLFFSDMLGNHNLGVSIGAYGSLQDIAGQVEYSNLSKRFDWAVGLRRIPYLSLGGYSQSIDPSGTVLYDQSLVFRQTYSTAYAVGALPFNRAQRFEVQASFQRVGFSTQVQTDAYSLIDGSFLGTDKQNLDSGAAPLNLGSVSAALVQDTSVFGATGPILGSRGRIEVGPTFGTINYTDVLVDLRKYFMPVRPLTVAFRLTHFGRYGSGSEDPRFYSLYLGYPDLIRGYDGIASSECVPNQSSSCPLYDQLFGSRLLFGNAELRAPLWGLFKGELTYGPLPIDVALFADAGVAWTQEDKAKLLGGDRGLLTSVGAALRVNVFGFMVVQTSLAHPFQRPGNSWVWQWTFWPAF
jgi:WD40 repeat protein